jgi:hypothetical protein
MKSIAIFFIKTVSAFFRVIGGRACRFHPSCSVYGTEAFSRHGFFSASVLTAGRVLRCQPFSAGGYDPVPESLWKKERS